VAVSLQTVWWSPLNVDEETLSQVRVDAKRSPEAADERATPVDSSGRSQPVPDP
jgi:hypothetical protein